MSNSYQRQFIILFTSCQKHLPLNFIEQKLFEMEFKRNSVIALYLAGKSQPSIVREVKHFKVNKMFVYRTITRYNGTGSVYPRDGVGWKKTARSPEMVRKVKASLEQNPRRSGNQMAKELKISQRSNRRILQNELKVKPYKFQKAHNLTPMQKKLESKEQRSCYACTNVANFRTLCSLMRKISRLSNL